MPRLEVDDETYALVRYAARLLRIPESEFIARAVHALGEGTPGGADRDPWEPVDVFAEYEGRRVTGNYIAATNRMTVTSEPLAGTTYRSPSAAARAVVAALNPARVATQTNGWRFWKVTATGQRLAVLR